ncbi:MAG: hypothetical protein KC656_01630 [Myxococcales bacterium]|nr:hypothetical protein [Myxococcales bacterium]MCB9692289.1 hypothetical protein [Alphaproteobacteria bacterium]
MDPIDDATSWIRPVHDGIQMDLSPVQSPPTLPMLAALFCFVSLASGYIGLATSPGMAPVGLLLGAVGSGVVVAALAGRPSKVLVTREASTLRIDTIAVSGTTSRRFAVSTIQRVDLGPPVSLRTTEGHVELPMSGRSRETQERVVAVLRAMLQTDIAGAEHVPDALKRVVSQKA